MKRAWSSWSLGLALLCAAPAGAATHKLGLIVGNNRGHDPARVLRFAERDAQKVHRVLLELGGFAPKDLVLLTGGHADAVWRVLHRLKKRAQTRAKNQTDRLLLVFYYSGHADGDVLELGDSSLGFDKLSRFIKTFPATVRLAWVDSCHSGKLVAAKGARRVPGFRVQVADQMRSSGYAMMTSSADDELSQESAEIRGSLFTHYLVSALRGAADQSGDGAVTLSETYRHVYAHTVARTSRHVGGAQHPMYEVRLQGRGEVVLTRTKRLPSALVVRNADPGRLMVLDHAKAQLVAEAEIGNERAARLALGPHRYVVYLLQPGSAQVARIRLREGRVTTLDGQRDFERLALRESVAKGGLFRPIWTSRVAVAALLRRWPLGEQPLSYGLGLSYRLETPGGWQPSVRFSWSTGPDQGASVGYAALAVQLGFGHNWHFGLLTWGAELLAGYEYLSQDSIEDGARNSSGFTYLGSTGLAVAFGGFQLGLDVGVGGQVFRVRDDGVTHSFDFQLLVGAGWKWAH